MKRILIAFLLIFSISCTKYDDTEIKNSVNCLEERVAKLEEQIKTINLNITSIQTILKNMENWDYITNVSQTTNGYVINFAKAGPIYLYNGKDGVNGTGSGTPTVISIKLYKGVYYWTVNGVFITDEGGEKVPVTGGEKGADGKSAYEIAVEHGFKGTESEWLNSLKPTLGTDTQGNVTITIGGTTVNIDNTVNITQVITSITQNGDKVDIKLPSGETISVPTVPSNFSFILPVTSLTFNSKETKSFSYTSVNEHTISHFAPTGWKVSILGKTISITACDATKEYNETSGTITFIVAHEDGRSIVRNIQVSTQSNNSGSGGNDGNNGSSSYAIGDIYYYNTGAMMGVVIEETATYLTIVHIYGPVKARFIAASNLTIPTTSATCGLDNKSILTTAQTYYPAWNYCLCQTGDDWYLPAWNEMHKIWQHRTTLNNVLRVALPDAKYWTSTLVGSNGYNQSVYPSTMQNLSTEAYIVPIKRVYK